MFICCFSRGVEILKAEDGPEKDAGQHHEKGGEEPGGNLGSHFPFAHLPVVVNADAADDAEDGGKYKGETERGEKGGMELVLGLLKFVKARLDKKNGQLHVKS